MDASGKVLWAKHSVVQQVNLKTIDAAALEALQGTVGGEGVQYAGTIEDWVFNLYYCFDVDPRMLATIPVEYRNWRELKKSIIGN